MPAPVAHATGLLSAVAIPLYTGCSVVLRDRWDADRAIDDMREYGVTFSAGAAVFMQELLDALAARGEDRLDLTHRLPVRRLDHPDRRWPRRPTTPACSRRGRGA